MTPAVSVSMPKQRWLDYLSRDRKMMAETYYRQNSAGLVLACLPSLAITCDVRN